MTRDGTITMSRACYEVAVRPAVENHEYPEPRWRKAGKGSQAVWPHDSSLLADLWDRVATYYASTEGWSDEDVARDRAAMKAWLDRYRPVMEPRP